MLLQTKAFHKIPPANIQAIFMRMQQINYHAGDVVLKQGAEGDYFYVLTRGKCLVTRETPLNKEGIKLAELVVEPVNAGFRPLVDRYLRQAGRVEPERSNSLPGRNRPPQ